MFELLPNDCFELDDRRYRYLGSIPGFVYAIELDNRIAWPCRLSLDDVLAFKAANRIRKIDTLMPVRPHTERMTDMRKGVVRHHHVIQLLKEPGIFDKNPRGQVIRKIAKASGVCKDALRDWLRKYWQGGQCRAALMGNYRLSGKVTRSTPGAIAIHIKEEGQEVVRYLSGAPRARGRNPRSVSGSKADAPRYKKFGMSEDDKLDVARIAWAHFGSDKSKSMDGAVTRVLAEKYIARGDDGNALYDADGDPILLPQGQRPTEHQIREIVEKTRSLSSAYKARHGGADYNNNVKPRIGSVMDDCNGPGDVYEVDATVLDVHLVDRETRQTIIGKPTFYLVTDRASRLIVGFHVSLDNPSWAEAKLAILNIAADWKEMAKRLKVKNKERDLIARGRFPNRFVADRGNDLLYAGSERLCDGLEIEVTNTRALSSVSKAIVESMFKGIQTPLRQFTPGYEPPEDIGVRRVKPHSKGADLTLDAIRRVLMRQIIARNRMPMNGYKASAKEIFLKEGISPLDIWERGVETTTSYGFRFPYAYLRKQLMSEATAVVLSGGLKFGHCYYDSPEIHEWRVKATLRKSFPVKVLYESSWVNEVIVLDPDDTSKTFVAKQIDPRWKNYSFAERHAAYLADNHNKLLGKDTARIEKVLAYLGNEEVYQEEHALTADANRDTTYGSRQTGGKPAREREKKDRRNEIDALFQPEAACPADDKKVSEVAGSPASTSRNAARDAGLDKADSEATASDFVEPSEADGDASWNQSRYGSGADTDDVLEQIRKEAARNGSDGDFESNGFNGARDFMGSDDANHSNRQP